MKTVKLPHWRRINHSHPLARGLKLDFPLSEGTGDRINDLSGQRNHGTAYGASWVPGKYGHALSFNGSSSKISISGVMDLSAQEAVSIAAWFRPASPSEYAGVTLGEGVQTNFDGIVLRTTGNNNDQFQALIVTPYPANYRYALDPTKYDFGLWYHVAGIYTVSDLYLFVNGVEVAHNSGSAGTVNFSNFTDDKVRIGADESYSPDRFYKGSISDVSIYNRVLSAHEVEWLYREPYAMFS